MTERIRVLIADASAETRGQLSELLASEADVVSDGRTVVYALNRGVPFSASNPEAQVSRDVKRLAEHLLRADMPVPAEPVDPRQRRKSLLVWR